MTGHQPNLRKLAMRHRWMSCLFALVLASEAATYVLPSNVVPGNIDRFFVMMYGVIQLLTAVGVALILDAMGSNLLAIAACILLLFIPFGNLIMIFTVYTHATGTLRPAGFRVGLMGISKDDIRRHSDHGLCNGCGYDLTGNVSGTCPECGTAI